MFSFNRAVVLEMIRHSGDGLTRAQLGRLTGLSPQTVSNVTREPLDQGLITKVCSRVDRMVAQARVPRDRLLGVGGCSRL